MHEITETLCKIKAGTLSFDEFTEYNHGAFNNNYDDNYDDYQYNDNLDYADYEDDYIDGSGSVY